MQESQSYAWHTPEVAIGIKWLVNCNSKMSRKQQIQGLGGWELRISTLALYIGFESF